MMKLLSVHVAEPREVEYNGKRVRSSIWKEPVSGAVEMNELNLAGDRQATAVIHGGIHKAAYAFSHDHYDWWMKELQRDDLSYGMFGENLTIRGLDETKARVGDQWQVGTCRFVITGPRIPCSNLAMKFGDATVPKRFTDSGWSGVYLRVLETGTIAAGDSVRVLSKGKGASIQALFHAFTHPRMPESRPVPEKALTNPYLDPEMAGNIHKRLDPGAS